MVAGALLQRAVRALARDWRALTREMRVTFGPGRSPCGLHTYRIASHGGHTTLHLRIHDDGSGALFVDVWDVVHLSPQAAEMAYLLLEGLTVPQALHRLRAWYPDAGQADLQNDLGSMSQMLAILSNPSQACRTCAPGVWHTPIFGTRAVAPYRADIVLTYRCNNRCGHCYNAAERRAMADMELAVAERILHRLAAIGVPHVVFTGGEPTLWERLPSLIRCARSLGLVTGLNTNGRRLSDPAFAESLVAAGLDHVQVTVNSHRPEVHNQIVAAPAFLETVAGVVAALNAGLHIITNTTLTRCNAKHAPATVKFVHSLGVRTFAMNSMICAGGGWCNPTALDEKELAPILAEVRDLGAELGMRFLWYTPTEYCRLSPLELELGPKCCSAAEYAICVEPNGDVLPCQSYYQPCGNLLRDAWTRIWSSPLFRALRERREAPKAAGLPERCWDCPDLEVCGGGCPLRRAESSVLERRNMGLAVAR